MYEKRLMVQLKWSLNHISYKRNIILTEHTYQGVHISLMLHQKNLLKDNLFGMQESLNENALEEPSICYNKIWRVTE